MVFWVLLALMTAAVVLVVIAPMARPAGAFPAQSGEETRVYRDQLSELDRDRERGLIAGEEADAAHAEIGRRLLAATRAPAAADAPRPAVNRLLALMTVVAIPAIALPLYLLIGQPDMPDAPLAERLSAAPVSGNVADMVGRVEKHLAANPDDLSGWRVIAPIYARMGRLDDAVKAWGKLVAAGGADAELLENYGAGLVDTNDGIVSPEAQSVLARAIAADPERARARFYYAEGLRQTGAFAEALDQVDELIRRSPSDAPWLETARGKRRDILAALKKPADTPEPPTLPAAGLTIEGMVDQLAARLAAEPDDRDGWIRLMRSNLVLGRAEQAKAALADARKALAGNAEALAAIDAAAAKLGIDTQEGQ
ncbi:Cytochrome c-type biogenesis protein CycH [uncultured Pleomorphomonas sp.]|uniref:Cytochrome c-type biogenesis protein CycH n=1 Tax=uncultured Pleomorphomonas sp. TaxID=442121 RepID=A0A212LDK8_9HYPH|nr:c-type cytochrome biogenesis protein CcmI [uncultured Pleomorphomonas sp.]SCM75558.1 Cytochrome c-type biogenesis protein CycH [uncultured Pleomorphomonas sp.]